MTRSAPPLSDTPSNVRSELISEAWECEPRKLLARWRAVLIAIGSGFLLLPMMQFGDLQISTWARTTKWKGDLEKAIQLSETFAHGSGVIVIFLCLLWIDLTNRRKLWNVAAYVLAVAAIANGCKYLVPRLRPNSGISIDQVGSTWLPILTGIGRKSSELSFPSGHSATAVALAIALSMVYPRGKWLFATLALLACWQRVYAGAHYLSDCFAGAMIALIVALLWRFPNKLNSNQRT